MSLRPLKIILLGDEKVGKTSLYDKYVNSSFPSSYNPSNKAIFKKTIVNVTGESIDLQFWDTPGNEKKHQSYMSIYLKTNGIIVLFDLTNKKTFENVLKKWIPNFFNFLKIKQSENVPVIILGNFNDLKDKRQITSE